MSQRTLLRSKIRADGFEIAIGVLCASDSISIFHRALPQTAHLCEALALKIAFFLLAPTEPERPSAGGVGAMLA